MNLRLEDFTFLIMRLNRSLKKLKNNRLAMGNYRTIHVTCMYYLYVYGAMTASELCKRCDEDKAAISRALKYLDENGCIVNPITQNCKYKNQIALTEKGRLLGQLVTVEVENIVQSLAPTLSMEERYTLFKLLTKLCDGLDKAANR